MVSDIQSSTDHDWVELPKYIETNPSEIGLVSLISTVIAAGDSPESQFQVKSVKELNPEVLLVSLISTAIATGDYPDKKFVVTSIKKRK